MRNTYLIIATTVAIFSQFAGTANGDIIVNVNGRLNVPPQFSQSGGLLEQFLTAGDYTFTLVNNVSGHSSNHPQASYTAWSFHTPGSNWVTAYNVSYDDNDATNDTLDSNYIGPDRLTGGSFAPQASALEAFDAVVAADGLSFNVTIPFDQTIGFYFSDQVISDNAGGVSVKIDPVTVPEPSLFGMLGAVGAGLFLLRRRRR